MSQELNPVRIYDSHYRGACTSERGEQISCMEWLREYYPDRFSLIFHCPNETNGNIQHGEMRRRQGVKSGVPDIFDAGGTDTWRSGMFELKRLDKSKTKTSKEQKDFLANGASAGSFCAICYGAEEFKKAYLDFLSLSPLQSS